MNQNEEGGKFAGTPWKFIQMVRRACVVCEYVRLGKEGVLKLLTDNAAYQAAAEETGITYEAVKAEMRRKLASADQLDKIMEKVEKSENGE